MMTRTTLAVILLCALACPGWTQELGELKKLSLEELMDLEVLSASKKPEKVSRTAAAVFVITAEDIRRAGATSIAEALRLAPGVNVARLTSNQWAISVRGFNDQFANKLLVLMDGRHLYSHIFQGVLWEDKDTLLEDIDRIEIIRGPGGALWGANAVNGVINIITKGAKETPGLLTYAGGGTQERGFGGVRYGGKLGKGAYLRTYAKYLNRSAQVLGDGSQASDAWSMGQGGFRLDWESSPKDTLTLQGDLYRGEVGDSKPVPDLAAPSLFRTITGRDRKAGGNAQARWQHAPSPDSNFILKLYYDRVEVEKLGIGSSNADVLDLDFQHRFPWGARQELVWGLGYRLNRDRTLSLGTFTLTPPARTTDLSSVFLQDEISLIEDLLRLTLGSKLERSELSGWEFEPGARLLWTPRENHALWAAVSRAVRTPSRLEHNLRYDLAAVPPGALVQLVPNPDFKSEELLAYELGYRLQPHKRLSLDLAAFYNVYDNLLSNETGALDPGPPAIIPIRPANKRHGQSYGAELAAGWQAADKWRLHAAYSFLRVQTRKETGSLDSGAEGEEGSSPRHQLIVRSLLELPRHLELDGALRCVSALPGRDVPSYVTADIRLGWRMTKNLELSLAGQNLLAPRHPEFSSLRVRSQATQVERSVYGKATWRF